MGYSPWGHKQSNMTEQLSVFIRRGRIPCTCEDSLNTKQKVLEGILTSQFGGNQLCHHLDFGLLASKIVRQYFCIFKLMVLLYSNPRKLTQRLSYS